MRSHLLISFFLLVPALLAGCLGSESDAALPTAPGDDPERVSSTPPSPGNIPEGAPSPVEQENRSAPGEGAEVDLSSLGISLKEDAAAAPLAAVSISEVPNFYHEVFRRPTWTEHPSRYIPGYPADALPLYLTLDAPTLKDALAADAETWASTEPSQLYYIPGTVFVGFLRAMQAFQIPDTMTGHGTGVAAHVVGLDAIRAPPVGIFVQYGFGWHQEMVLLEEEWVDLSSLSAGHLVPLPPGMNGEYGRLKWTEEGGIAVSGTANTDYDPHCGAPGLFSCPTRSPPWVVAVGRIDQHSDGSEQIKGGGPLDLSARYHACPRVDSFDRTIDCSGTSFATPRVAGLLATAIAEIRAVWDWVDCGVAVACTQSAAGPAEGPLSDGILERGELLDVVYRSATAGDRYHLDVVPRPDVLDDQGWGVLDEPEVEAALDVLWGRADLPVREEARADWMFYQTIRHSYWNNWIPIWEASQPICEVRYLPHCV